MLNAEVGVGCNSDVSNCKSASCPRVPDFCIKKNDTKPSFRISIADCDGVVDLTDDNLVLESNMWFEAKLKTNIANSDLKIYFADNVGFDKVLVGDVIFLEKPRVLEKVRVSSIDESDKSITVERAYDGTLATSWDKGAILKIYRFLNLPSQIESIFQDVSQVDGTTQNELTDTFFVFNWSGNQTSLAGCYWMEFKLYYINPDSGDVDWVKSFPLSSEGFLISVLD
jgi:hypothetical protein